MTTAIPGTSGRTPTTAERHQARATAIRWATTILAQPDTIFLDTETTGLDGNAEIVEIALIDSSGRVLLDTLVKPDGPIPAEVVAIHGIDDRMVAGAPHWRKVYPSVARLLLARPVIVYNADFDFRLVNQMNRRAGFAPLEGGWQCAMKQYGAFSTVWHERYGNYRFHKLDAALASFGHQPAGHRACADALGCRLVLAGMATAS